MKKIAGLGVCIICFIGVSDLSANKQRAIDPCQQVIKTAAFYECGNSNCLEDSKKTLNHCQVISHEFEKEDINEDRDFLDKCQEWFDQSQEKK